MAPAARARYLMLAGLAAASAAAAHGGTAALADPRWMLPAAAGAALAVLGLLAVGAAAAAASAAARELGRGRITRLCRTGTHRPLGLIEATALMVLAQASAHAGLLAAGAQAHTAAAGSLALHLALALVSAAVVCAVERLLATAFARLDEIVRWVLALLLARVHVPSRRAAPVWFPEPPCRLALSRAPPLST
ncbi:MAG TPA: hypothetical protein VE777_14165 [Gaiellales bacterium]|nr:hypothetical protein [Gaiellales bacterium]